MSRLDPSEEPVYNGCGPMIYGTLIVCAILIALFLFSGVLDAAP